MSKELTCQKCGALYMGDPWVDDFCESCRLSTASDCNRKSVSNSGLADVIANENDGESIDKNQIPNKTDAFTRIRDIVISVDAAGLCKLFRDKTFLAFFIPFILIILADKFMPPSGYISDRRVANATLLGFHILLILSFNCILLKRKYLVLVSVAGHVFAVITVATIGSVMNPLGREIFQTNKGLVYTVYLSIDALLSCFVPCILYLAYKGKIQHKEFDKREVLAILFGSALAERLIINSYYVRHVHETVRNVPYLSVVVDCFADYIFVSSFAVMFGNFILSALVFRERRGEALILAVISASVITIPDFFFLTETIETIVTIGAFILLFGYLARWRIYPLSLKASYETIQNGSISKSTHEISGEKKNCPKCRAPQKKNAKFCSKCGERLSAQ